MRNLLLGVAVLALVVGGVFWARGRSPAPVRAETPSEDAPDVTRVDGVVAVDDARLILSVSPRPPVAFQKAWFRVRVERHGRPAVLEAGQISFEMTMPMGNHRYSLVPGEEGWQGAEVVLPMCQSGSPRWYATVGGSVDGRALAARFRVDLAKPQ